MALEQVQMETLVQKELPTRKGNGVAHELPARKANGVAREMGKVNGIQQTPQDEAAALAAVTATARRVKIVEVGTGVEHELPGDTPTRDARTLAYFSYPAGAVLPLVMRASADAFYICGTCAADVSPQWLGLFGKLFRRCL